MVGALLAHLLILAVAVAGLVLLVELRLVPRLLVTGALVLHPQLRVRVSPARVVAVAEAALPHSVRVALAVVVTVAVLVMMTVRLET